MTHAQHQTGLFSRSEVARMLGISVRRLRYWSQAGLVRPSVSVGRRSLYSFQDLVTLRTACQLVEQGMRLRQVTLGLRGLIGITENNDLSLSRLRLRPEGDRLVVQDAGRIFDADSGQLHLGFEEKTMLSPVYSTQSSNEAQVIFLPWVRASNDSGAGDEQAQSAALSHGRLQSADDWYEFGTDCEMGWDGQNLQHPTFVQAKRAYERAIELDPDHAPALTNLGTIYAHLGDVDAARDFYDSAMSADPQLAEPRCNLGELALRAHDAELALQIFGSVLAFERDNIEALYGIARAQMALGRNGAAVRALERYCEALDEIPRDEWDDELERRQSCALAVIGTLRNGFGEDGPRR